VEGLTVIHSTLLAAVHGHPAAVATVTLPAEPVAAALWVVAFVEYVHPSDCVTLNRWPAIVSVPARGGPVVGAIEMITGALPRPFAPDVMAIHAESDVAVHVQSWLDARTSIRAVPPAPGKSADDCASEMTHAAADCVICARVPLTITAPVRVCGSGFTAAANSTVPSP
jgi:hypothetical protein